MLRLQLPELGKVLRVYKHIELFVPFLHCPSLQVLLSILLDKHESNGVVKTLSKEVIEAAQGRSFRCLKLGPQHRVHNLVAQLSEVGLLELIKGWPEKRALFAHLPGLQSVHFPSPSQGFKLGLHLSECFSGLPAFPSWKSSQVGSAQCLCLFLESRPATEQLRTREPVVLLD